MNLCDGVIVMIKFLAMDVDGTLTDGKIYMGNEGELFKAFDIKDGCGIKDLLPQYGIVPIIITARESKLLKKRCDELNIKELHQGVRDKCDRLKKIIQKYNDSNNTCFSLENCAYIGDDLLDLKCMIPIKNAGGILGCPQDAIEQIRSIADYVTRENGGKGAVREFIEYLIHIQESSFNVNIVEVRLQKAITYLNKIDLKEVPVGKYIIDDDIYYMVQEYVTKPISDCKLESHEKYIDIQWIVCGAEKICTCSRDYLGIIQNYDKEKDVTYYLTPDRMQQVVLNEGSYIILYPENAHMPSIAVEEPKKIKKVVVKVRV